MTKTSIADAKTQLTRLIHQAERGETVHITRRGKPVAVLLSEDEYARLRQAQESEQPDFWDLITEMRADPDFQPADWSREDVDSGRDRRPAQDFEWPGGAVRALRAGARRRHPSPNLTQLARAGIRAYTRPVSRPV